MVIAFERISSSKRIGSASEQLEIRKKRKGRRRPQTAGKEIHKDSQPHRFNYRKGERWLAK
jgi:hypothetical protein